METDTEGRKARLMLLANRAFFHSRFLRPIHSYLRMSGRCGTRVMDRGPDNILEAVECDRNRVDTNPPLSIAREKAEVVEDAVRLASVRADQSGAYC